MTNNTYNGNPNGASYFLEGWRLMMMPGLKRYILLPILMNIIIMGGAFFYLYQSLNGMIDWMLSFFPSWLQWLNYLLWPLLLLSALLFFGYFFTTLANIIAAPFNGMLAAKLEVILTGIEPTGDSWLSLTKDMGRSIQRELQTLAYYIPRLTGILLLFLVPVVGLVAPLILFIFNAWMMSIQYHDYAFDNHRISFSNMRQHLQKDRVNNLIFGSLVNICTMIPIINLFIMPAAVCGGTLHWVKKYRGDFIK